MRPVLAVLMLCAAPAGAQAPDFDIAPTRQCVAEIGPVPEAADRCTGRAADLCMEAPGGSTSNVMAFCLGEELTFWDDALNGIYQDLRAALQRADESDRAEDLPPRTEALRDMQSAWITLRDAQCDFEALQWQGGTGASAAYMGCLLTLTAQRTGYLWSVAEFLDMP